MFRDKWSLVTEKFTRLFPLFSDMLSESVVGGSR